MPNQEFPSFAEVIDSVVKKTLRQPLDEIHPIFRAALEVNWKTKQPRSNYAVLASVCRERLAAIR